MGTPKIYTRTGDNGTTSLADGKRVAKNTQRIKAYGQIDELNAAIGVGFSEFQSLLATGGSATASATESSGDLQAETRACQSDLECIQNELFVLGSRMACSQAESLHKMPRLPADAITRLEQRMDALSKHLAPLRNFILPGGTTASAHFHLARTICRRAECASLDLNDQSPIEGELITYLNRLSDYLFVLARFCNQVASKSEILFDSSKYK